MSEKTPILINADLKSLEEYLDGSETNTNTSVSPKKRGSSPCIGKRNGNSSPNGLDMAVPGSFDNYRSQLEGWSPAIDVSEVSTRGMEELSLGPPAESIPTTNLTSNISRENKNPTKAHREIEKQPKLSKKERRELQEAQRAAKAAGIKLPKPVQANKPPVLENPSPSIAPQRVATIEASLGSRMQYDDPKRVARRSKTSVIQRTQAQKQVTLFSHLPQYERESSLSLNVGFSKNEIHPAILSLGLKYSEGKIRGGNARCVAMLTAFKQVVNDYITPPDKILSRDLDKKLRPLIQFVIDCRPHSISMGNAIRFVRNVIATIPPEISDEEAKQTICVEIDKFIQERILIPIEGIVASAVAKVADGDVIMTYARSHVVEKALKSAKEQGRQFRVIVVDARPLNEGKELVRTLSHNGIQCTYVLLSGLSYIMREVTKVFLGASAFMSNGVAIARVGTAAVAMTARAYNVPVMFCCETYKFSDRVQLDSITQNELGDPDELVVTGREEGNILSDWRDIPSLKLLNLVYDVTPTNYVSMVITEVGTTPATSIPVLIREYRKEMTL